MANNYEVDINDSRLTGIKGEEQSAINASNSEYDKMISQGATEFGKQTTAVNEWEKTQTDIQNEQTEFAIDKVEQQKDWAQKDYIKEQSGAWTDYQKQSNQYGANAEQMAAQGLTNTGYSESSLVSMYNTYQNRVAVARESYTRAVVDYDNMIKEARLQNNAALAEIANNALQKRLEISMASMQYKNNLLQEKAKAKREISNNYWQLYSDMYGKIHQENALKEGARQHDEQMAETKRHNQAQEALARDQFNWQKAQAAKSSSGGGTINKGSSGSRKTGNSYKGGSGGKISSKGKSKKSSKETGNLKPVSTKKDIVTVDMQSVLDLGFGPISAKQLSNLKQSGKIEQYVEDGKYKFKKTSKFVERGGRKGSGRTKDFRRVYK